MRLSKDKKQQRYQMVIYAKEHGVKPTARLYATTPKTVRKWLLRFIEGGYKELDDLSRRPHHSPRAVPEDDAKHIIKLKTKYKRVGAEHVRILENLSTSAKTIRKIWRKNGVSSRCRRKKHVTKQNLREIKKQFALFERSCEDTKDLFDIPEYWPQMRLKGLPKTQYTFREVSCGVQFLGFADERSLTHAELFAEYINEHLKRHGLIVENGIRQTDNGSEYIGSWSAKEPSAYTLAVESEKLIHGTIPPGAHRFQSDVETVHNLIETEFYEIERFADRREFMEKAHTYQLFFNLERPNTYKEDKSPWQLAKEKRSNLPKKALMLPPVDLDALLDKKLANQAIGGYHVYSAP
ncbi:MAG: helix-turn-helix domain-containing protein [Candidatus Omnitrophica bacterium]|nr:helix-turn-helix domain-containing protein [Candidatus Omnitrophota bacterium]MBU1933477.1 helix-turn-helix domain-containing protein [Candidatus Omnitrophota bacterium]